MTERKPPGTSWETWIEAQIRVAREQGAFDNLPGAGKPLPYLGQEYDPDWWVKQLVQREQISILPPSLELLRKVDKELGQKNKITRRWARRGTRPAAPHDQRTRSAYIFGAICPARGTAAGLILPRCNTAAMALHLAEISRTVTLVQ